MILRIPSGVLAIFLAIALPGTGFAQTASPGANPPPNIVLILVDDLGYGDLGCYGATKQATPNIDRIAAEGIRFSDFYMSAPVCSPSRAALLTGCYHKRLNVNHVLWPVSPRGLNSNEVTIAEVLRDRGYPTQFFGKWHVGDQKVFLPTRQGFDHNHGIPYSHDMPSLVRLKKDKGQLNPLQVRVLPVLRDEKVEELVRTVTPLMRTYEEEAIEFMEACQGAGQPFFAMLAQHAVHLPNQPSKDYRNSSKNGAYGDWIRELDDSVGRILDAIAALGADQNTLVMLTSDNGPSRKSRGTAAPLRGFKHSTWEGGVRVPLVARWPGTIPGGQTCSEIVACMDLLPTLAAFAGISAPAAAGPIDGVDCSALFLDRKPAESPRRTFAYYQGPHLLAVRRDHWKLHLKSPDRRKNVLIDLKSDRGESTDLAAENPGVVSELTKLAGRFRAELGDGVKKGSGERRPGRVLKAKALFEAVSHPFEQEPTGGDEDQGELR